MTAGEAAEFVRETVLGTGVPGVSRAELVAWFEREQRNLEARIGRFLGQWLTPTTTPGTRISYRSLREWIEGLGELRRRHPRADKYEQLRAHVEALTEALIATGDADDLDALGGILRDRTVRRPRGSRDQDPVTGHLDALDREVARRRRAGPPATAATPAAPAAAAPVGEGPPDLWTPAQRTRANLAAMGVLAAHAGSAAPLLTDDERRVLAGYSGWGGLSITGAAEKFPAGVPVPDPRGLIHEYYTPTIVAREIAREIGARLDTLPRGADGRIHALEPSAGIGRLARAAWRPSDIDWTLVEWSELSAMLLTQLLSAPGARVEVYQGPFERWVRENEGKASFGLVLANPPYGARGASKTEDPVRAYRETRAYPYFMRRAADLLDAGGLSVWVVPSGFISGRSADTRRLRELVLRRHHLAGAFRLPSETFPGALITTDVVFLRARGGELEAPVAGDAEVIEGDYFRLHPSHILGVEEGTLGGDEDRDAGVKKGRYGGGYEVKGTFTGFPSWVERPICSSCDLRSFVTTTRKSSKGGAVRVTDADRLLEGLTPTLADAVRLGMRLDAYLAERSAGTERAVELHAELVDAMRAWVERAGNPWASLELQQLAKSGNTGAERFLSGFDRSGRLLEAVATSPVYVARYTGGAHDVEAQAAFLARTGEGAGVAELAAFHREQGGRLAEDTIAKTLRSAGWWQDDPSGSLAWFPSAEFLTGALWPKYDRCKLAGRNGEVNALLRAIRPAAYEDIEGVDPRQRWIPLELVNGWMGDTINARWGDPDLEYRNGLLLPRAAGGELADVEGRHTLSNAAILCLGWINHDRTMFRPHVTREENIDEKRAELAKEFTKSFLQWVAKDPARKEKIEASYQRHMQGWIAPAYTAEPLSIARWGGNAPRPHPHQQAGARRVLANRGGLIAFDVGVGKTFTATVVLGRARQEGWARRPVICVPNSIVWKWYNDLRACLPDYRIGVVGSKLKTMTRGTRRGEETSEIDTPEERAQTWSTFQAGGYDVVLVTYTALPRTRINEDAVVRYAEATSAIQRELALRKRNAAQKKNPTERELAILNEGMAAWVAEQVELPESWEYDPGVAWDEIGVDLFILDEAQNFKNLYLPEPREGGVPRFMGSAGDGAKRAWTLDFRLETVRRRAGGAGVVLLSATPAKNSPLEFYNLIQYVDPRAWTSRGIHDPEAFIDRYCRIESKQVLDSSLSVTTRAACVGFINLHELRDVVFRYGDFKTAEDVGLKLPEPTVQLVEVDMDARQDRKYAELVADIERAMASKDPKDKAQILGLLARMSLISIHGRMDEVNVGDIVENAAGKRVKRIDQAARRAMIDNADPHSPKFTALAERIRQDRACGHIVFLELTAGHEWVTRVLVEAGVARDRIAILSGIATPTPADRLRVAKAFNGDPREGIPPKYDVVICNQVAYEGIDLQTRTCAIHHLDLPWEPATLQQRNGRGVRQGNTLATIAINYYFARRSMDGQRFDLIRNKQGWMSALIKGQARDTNNPGAQSDLSPDEILVLISRNPDKTRALLNELRAKKEEEARQQVAANAVRAALAANARFRRAERQTDPEEAARLRADAEARLADLALVDPAAWPWAAWAMRMRECPVVVPPVGPVLHAGQRFMVPSDTLPGAHDYYEVGAVDQELGVRIRKLGEAVYATVSVAELAGRGRGALDPAGWPEDVEALGQLALRRVDNTLYTGHWPLYGFEHAADAFRVTIWPVIAPKVRPLLIAGRAREDRYVPGRVGRSLAIFDTHIPGDLDLFPPTNAGWADYLARVPSSGESWTRASRAARYWWGRTLPRGIMGGDKGDA